MVLSLFFGRGGREVLQLWGSGGLINKKRMEKYVINTEKNDENKYKLPKCSILLLDEYERKKKKREKRYMNMYSL